MRGLVLWRRWGSSSLEEKKKGWLSLGFAKLSEYREILQEAVTAPVIEALHFFCSSLVESTATSHLDY